MPPPLPPARGPPLPPPGGLRGFPRGGLARGGLARGGIPKPFTGRKRSTEELNRVYSFWQPYGGGYPITAESIQAVHTSMGVNTSAEDAKKMLGSFVGTESADQVDFQTFVQNYDRCVDSCKTQALEFAFELASGGKSQISSQSAQTVLATVGATMDTAALLAEIGKDKKTFTSELSKAV